MPPPHEPQPNARVHTDMNGLPTRNGHAGRLTAEAETRHSLYPAPVTVHKGIERVTVTEPQPHPENARPAEPAMPALEETGTHVGDEAKRDAADNTSSRTSAQTAGGTTSGTSGGFDTLLGKLVVNAGFCTPEEVEACNSMLAETESDDSPRTLSDILLDNEFVTNHQLSRLRGEFEAKKSSQRIPGYKIKRKLGSGAMATVFLAKQESLDRLVAVKVLPKKFSDNEKFVERFYKEGRAAAQLNHPNIVSAVDVGKAGEHYYFVMEYVEGPTVYDSVKEHKRFDEARAIDIVTQVARALEHAHKRGFIHRDIKPKNIMLAPNGRVKLADLGLARAMSDEEAARAEMGRAYGTPYYISPEQIRGELKIGPTADIYGLGATFYHMVTGRVPFEGKNPSAVMHKHLKAELVPPDHLNPKLSAGCAQVIEKMMAKHASDRYQNTTDLLHDLELIAKGESPHFARSQLDHARISSALTDEVTAPAIKEAAPPPPPSLFDSPAFMAVAVLLGLSLVANLIMIIMLVT
jgi:serine/threonine protein kinase